MKFRYETIISIDTESSGLISEECGLLEIGACVLDICDLNNPKEISCFESFCNPGNVMIQDSALAVNGIKKEDIPTFPPIVRVLWDFIAWTRWYHKCDDKDGKTAILGQGFAGDIASFNHAFRLHVPELRLATENFFRRTIELSSVFHAKFPERKIIGLEKMGRFFNVPNQKQHTALGDARQTGHVYLELMRGTIPPKDGWGKENHLQVEKVTE